MSKIEEKDSTKTSEDFNYANKNGFTKQTAKQNP